MIVWNYHDVDGAGEAVGTTVDVGGVPAGVKRVLVEEYRVDATHSNAYTVWKGMGSPQAPTGAQYAALKAAGHLEMAGSPVWMEVVGGRVRVETEMSRQGVSLFRLKW